MAAAWILVLRPLVHFVCLLPALGRWRRPDWRAPVLAEAWRRARPLLAGTAYYKLDPLLDRFLASMAPPGGLSLLTIGQQLYSAGAQVITRAMVVPIVPTLTTHAAQGRWRSFRSSYRRALLLTGGAVAASCLALVAGRGWVTDLIGRFSELDPTEAAEFWTILVVLLGLFAGGSLGQITSTGFYAMTDTRTPARLGVRLFTLYVPAKLLSFFLFGLIGLAGSISGYYMVTLFVQLAVLENTVRRRALGEKVPGGAELMTDGRIPP
jgi:peptidoglycan biosynthesis protein MviN/MurJ (putative lipid II flippase)